MSEQNKIHWFSFRKAAQNFINPKISINSDYNNRYNGEKGGLIIPGETLRLKQHKDN